MNSKYIWSALQVGAMVLLMVAGAAAQLPKQTKFCGSINDFTPLSVSPTGPWEVRGDWTLILLGDSGKALFSASLTMVRSDEWDIVNGDPDDPSLRVPHTHHITVLDGTAAAITGGFEVNGTASVAASGNPAPFGQFSSLQIDVTGGTLVPYSNIKLTFGDPANTHFGTQPLEGVVRNCK
jgi:hypothetical protein